MLSKHTPGMACITNRVTVITDDHGVLGLHQAPLVDLPCVVDCLLSPHLECFSLEGCAAVLQAAHHKR
jgi:hypothetical protein